MILEASALGFAYGRSEVLKGVDVRIGPGLTALVGPNAAGKSTLLKCLCGLLRPEGRVSLDGRELGGYAAEALSRRISHLPQAPPTQAAITVFEAVLLGRLDHLGWRVGPEDAGFVERLLGEMDLSDLADRYVDQLSGGQAQMVGVAQALAREPAVLLMDEPTSSLDLRHQYEVCGRIRDLTLSRGMTTVVALHDLNLAARFADVVCILEGGKVQALGTPAEVLTEAAIRSVYRIEAQVRPDDRGRPTVTVLGLA